MRSSALLLAMISLLLSIGLPPGAYSTMRSPTSSDPLTPVMECILTIWSQTSECLLTIWKTNQTGWQYTSARRSWSNAREVTRGIFLMTNCTQLSDVFSMVFKLQLRVLMQTHIWDISIHRQPAVVLSWSTKQHHLWNPMLCEVLWCAEWAFPVETARTIKYQIPNS